MTQGSLLSAPLEGEPYFGQDAQYGSGFMYLIDHGNGTVLDNSTGLMWEKKGAKNNTPDLTNPNDSDNTYTWDEIQDFISDLNQHNYGGYNDWRMATTKELETLHDLSEEEGGGVAIVTNIFTNTQQGKYWSGDSHADDPNMAWCADFDGSLNSFLSKSNSLYVRAVRGQKVFDNADNFTVDSINGVITDPTTEFVWQIGESSAHGNDIAVTWENALAYAASHINAGLNCWRLPNRKELENIIDRSRANPAIYDIFDWNPGRKYWTATPVGNSGEVWIIDFSTGTKEKVAAGGTYYVRAVAGGTENCSLDLTPPVITSTTPQADAIDVAPNTLISVTFSEQLDNTTINDTTFIVNSLAGPVNGTVVYTASTSTAVFTPK